MNRQVERNFMFEDKESPHDKHKSPMRRQEIGVYRKFINYLRDNLYAQLVVIIIFLIVLFIFIMNLIRVYGEVDCSKNDPYEGGSNPDYINDIKY